ncbi:hypothetical protein OAI77_01435 [Candidatus Nitrosopelagicus sp.]|nr:hypothetical protein [Candidatus Nitrosopelagicus sp.]
MDNFEKTLTSKYDELAKESRELRKKIETLAKKHDEMVPHVNNEKKYINIYRKGANEKQTIEQLMELQIANEARKAGIDWDFTFEEYRKLKEDVETNRKRMDKLDHTLHILQEIWQKCKGKGMYIPKY